MSQNSNSIGLNELVDYQKKTYSPNMGKVMKFLWKCAGADPQILQYSPYSDHIKNAGIGGVVLATTVMATMAMGFAMHTIFASPVPGKVDPITGAEVLRGNWFITIPVSLIWGLIIFNLDRFIVSTVKGDGTEKITKEEFWAMLPRLVMAIIIGLTISAPLETYIFKREIDREWKLSLDKLALSKAYEVEQTEGSKYNQDLQNFKNIQIDRDRQQSIYDKAYQEYQDELSGKNRGNGYGDGPVAKAKKEIAEKEAIKLNELNSKLAARDSTKLNNESEIKRKQDSVSKETKEMHPGFLDQLMMLERLSSHGKEVEKYNAVTKEVEQKKNEKTGKMEAVKEEIYGSAFWPIWLVRLLFMIIEIAPVIFKFMIWKSSYDYMQDNVAQILEAKQGISLEIITDENNNLHKVKENYNARRIVEVYKRQNELEKENAIHAITLFAEKEREEIESDPSKFVKSDTAPGNSDGNEQPVVV
jgi:uncharacterized membrane protein